MITKREMAKIEDVLGVSVKYLDDTQDSYIDDFKFEINETALNLLYQQLNKERLCFEQKNTIRRCEEGEFYTSLMGYGFLFLFTLAIIGNLLNLMVYVTENIRFLFAIRMLCMKLLVNTLTMVILLPNALRLIGLWEAGSSLDNLYWKLWTYQAFFVNVFGFVGIYMSVLMVAECFIHIFMPLKSKEICTKTNLFRSYVVICIFGVLLAGIYPLNRIVRINDECKDNIFVTITMADSSYFLQIYERFHMLFNLLMAIILPLVLLVLMSAAIVWRLNSANSSSSKNGVGKFGSEKRNVVRITLITTSLQLFSELPSVPVFAFVSLFGASAMNETSSLCTLQTLSQFVGIFNVSLSFFVYLLFSPRFRQAILSRFCVKSWKPHKPSLSNRSTPSKRLSTFKTDETHLIDTRNLNSTRNPSCTSETLGEHHPQSVRFLITRSTDFLSVTTDESKEIEVTNFL